MFLSHINVSLSLKKKSVKTYPWVKIKQTNKRMRYNALDMVKEILFIMCRERREEVFV